MWHPEDINSLRWRGAVERFFRRLGLVCPACGWWKWEQPCYAEPHWRRAERKLAAVAPADTRGRHALFHAYNVLKSHGWQDIIYCPKDGTVFDAIEIGSTGVHQCYYSGDWPTGSWWIMADDDIWPARPILWRPRP